jgi:hypothetical protein
MSIDHVKLMLIVTMLINCGTEWPIQRYIWTDCLAFRVGKWKAATGESKMIYVEME